jgi:hypothetical protein
MINDVNFGIYQVDRDPSRAPQLVKIISGSAAAAERLKGTADRIAKQKNADRDPGEKRFYRYTVRKLSPKAMQSPEIQDFLDAEYKNTAINSIIEDGDYMGRRLFKHPLTSTIKQFFQKHRKDLTIEDLQNWDWNKAVVSVEASEGISTRYHTSTWSTVVEFAIPLNGEIYEVRAVEIGEPSRL